MSLMLGNILFSWCCSSEPPIEPHQEFLRQFDSELAAWNSHLDKVMACSELQDPNVNLMKWTKRKFKDGKFSWREGVSIRDQFKPALCKIVAHVLQEFLPQGTSIVELGSNTLNSDGQSYLSSLMPSNYSETLSFSDFLPHIVVQEREKTDKPYLLINAKKIGNVLRKESQECFVSLSVLDVIEWRKIHKVASAAFETLKSGGYFIVFTDRAPYVSSLLEKYSRETGRFVTPWVYPETGVLRGIKVTSRHAFEAKMRSELQTMPRRYKQFFTKFLSLTQAQQERFLIVSHQYASKFLNCIDLFLPKEETESLELGNFYFQDITAELQKAGFEIKCSQKLGAEALVRNPKVDKNENGIEYDVGTWDVYQAAQAPSGVQEVRAFAHVIVAKKPAIEK